MRPYWAFNDFEDLVSDFLTLRLAVDVVQDQPDVPLAAAEKFSGSVEEACLTVLFHITLRGSTPRVPFW
jgi:hypothetical protein